MRCDFHIIGRKYRVTPTSCVSYKMFSHFPNFFHLWSWSYLSLSNCLKPLRISCIPSWWSQLKYKTLIIVTPTLLEKDQTSSPHHQSCVTRVANSWIEPKGAWPFMMQCLGTGNMSSPISSNSMMILMLDMIVTHSSWMLFSFQNSGKGFETFTTLVI